MPVGKRGRIETYENGKLVDTFEDRTPEEIKADDVAEAKRAATKVIEDGPVPLWKAINALAGVYDAVKSAAVLAEYNAFVQAERAKVEQVEDRPSAAGDEVKSKRA